MKRLANLLSISFFLLFSTFPVCAEEAPQAVKDLAQTKLASFGSDQVIVAAVKEQNSKGTSLDDIKKMDTKWQATAGTDDFMNSLMASGCGIYLKEIMKSEPYFAEIFVMDNQGANVSMTGKTSDYWQGDEAKFQKAYGDGRGTVFVDDVEFDDSSQAYLVQISVPVMDGNTAIGVITFGIDVDKVH